MIRLIIASTAIVAGIGFAGSYAAVRELALKKGFGNFAYVFPVGIDAGICVLLALDLLLTWIRIPFPLLRQTAWLLTAATIAFNGAAAWPDPLGVGMHGVIPVLFIVAVEAARHAIGRIADITADKHMEGVRLTRWLLSPVPTFLLWRRMKLWELRSYEQVIKLEQERLVYRARLHSRFGRAWRRKAPVESLMPLRLARYGVPLAETAPAGLAAAGIEPVLLPPAPQWEDAEAGLAADGEPAASDAVAKAVPAAAKMALPGMEHSTPVSHTSALEHLQAPRPGSKAERELETHLQARAGSGQQAGRSPGRDVPGSSAYTSQYRTTGEPFAAHTSDEHHDHTRARPSEASSEQPHPPTARMTAEPDAAAPAHPTHARARLPRPPIGTHRADPTYRETTAPDGDPLSFEQRSDQPAGLQATRPRPSAAATRDQLARAGFARAAVRGAGTTPLPRTPQTSSPVHRTQHRSADGNLTLPDRYYLAWIDYQSRHGTEPTGQELSAHLATQGLLGRGRQPVSPANLRRHFLRWRIYALWARQRLLSQAPSPADIAHQCARRGIAAQYNKPITADYVARLIVDFERRWQVLSMHRPDDLGSSS
ncbi:DUF2637 domain-containing protein [Streptomyces sp. NPDC102394]|uniref:DUF2637 domain-containing protein n=2 Tax=Streptomyces TaxID=1883 RepID=UPI0037F7917D